MPSVEQESELFETWRCRKCGTHWKKWPNGTWSVVGDAKPCCDNVTEMDVERVVIVSKAFVEAADALADSIDAYWKGASSDRGGAALAAYRTQRANMKP